MRETAASGGVVGYPVPSQDTPHGVEREEQQYGRIKELQDIIKVSYHMLH